MKITCKRINQALIDAGFEGVEIFRGDGYCYFWPHGIYQNNWLDKCIVFGYPTSVMVPRLSDLSIEQWVEELRQLQNKFIGAM